jgi:hypothetical protein
MWRADLDLIENSPPSVPGAKDPATLTADRRIESDNKEMVIVLVPSLD